MKIVKNENPIFCDIDGTLILPYDSTASRQVGRIVHVYDALTDKKIRMVAHEPMIRILLEERRKGKYIVVWSRSGQEWAANVVRALDLVASVDLVISKPLVYLDDTPVETWMKDRVFLPADMIYKR